MQLDTELPSKKLVEKHKTWSLEHYQAECKKGFFDPTWIEEGAAFHEYILKAVKEDDFDTQFNLGYFFLHCKRPNYKLSQYYYDLAAHTIEYNVHRYYNSRAWALFNDLESNMISDKKHAFYQLVADECPIALKVNDIDTLDFDEGFQLMMDYLSNKKGPDITGYDIFSADPININIQKWRGFVALHIQKDTISAITHYEFAANNNDKTSQIALARIYENGYGAGFGLIKEYFLAGYYFEMAGLYKVAERCYKIAIDEGDTRIESLFEEDYKKNLLGPRKDLAFYYYNALAKKGIFLGLSAISYYHSIKSPNAFLTERYNVIAAENGCVEATERLLCKYLESCNYVKALYYYEKYCNQYEGGKLPEQLYIHVINMLIYMIDQEDYASVIKVLQCRLAYASMLMLNMGMYRPGVIDRLFQHNMEEMILVYLNSRGEADLVTAFHLGAKAHAALCWGSPKNTEQQALERIPKEDIKSHYYERLYDFLVGEGGTNEKSFKYQVVSKFFCYAAKSEGPSLFAPLSDTQKLSADEFVSKVIQTDVV